jgi:hypothetical protein
MLMRQLRTPDVTAIEIQVRAGLPLSNSTSFEILRKE